MLSEVRLARLENEVGNREPDEGSQDTELPIGGAGQGGRRLAGLFDSALLPCSTHNTCLVVLGTEHKAS